MRICPNCRKNEELDLIQNCKFCGWTISKHNNDTPILLSDDDLSSGDFDSYLKNYDELSINNLKSPEGYGLYLKIQNDKLYSYCGNLTNKNVCEVGFGRGYLFKKILSQNPKSMVGIDISPTYIERLRNELKNENNIELVMANAENIPYRDEFDCIVASDVLEHVLNPGNFIFCVNQALREDGKFIVRVPCNENILVYSKFMGCQFKYAHLRNFNKSSLKAILTNSGFKVEKIYYDGYLPSRKRSYVKKISWINKLFDRFVVAGKNDQNEVATINNKVGRLFMKPIEIVLVCKKNKNLISKVEHPEIKSFKIENSRSFLTWEYEHYKPNSVFEFILNISERSSGKVLLSKLIGDTLNCEIDLSFLETKSNLKANIYAVHKDGTMLNSSKDFDFELN
ncbi:class I SAM-dependent methyltransferase [Legionella spiritensis]|uniref:class I SAM-dependent methyltransferase n=1 Tax=Legionella spiritensis TaxID=452 RepID=UPI000F714230|nr:class I SAM-dependent methyltransferase [Legionella spiritensis]VEG89663.1 Probable S-adenosylmethionine-dependent methyltransferase MSMEG_2350 [Legionella spiritensis]